MLCVTDSVDAMKRGMELGKQLGHQRRTKDILGWLKKKRRHIRREELIAYLCGKSPPPRPRPTATLSRAAACHHPGALHRGGPGTDRSSPRLHSHSPGTEPCDDPSAVVGAGAPGTEPDLRPFRDALALQSKTPSYVDMPCFKQVIACREMWSQVTRCSL